MTATDLFDELEARRWLRFGAELAELDRRLAVLEAKWGLKDDGRPRLRLVTTGEVPA